MPHYIGAKHHVQSENRLGGKKMTSHQAGVEENEYEDARECPASEGEPGEGWDDEEDGRAGEGQGPQTDELVQDLAVWNKVREGLKHSKRPDSRCPIIRSVQLALSCLAYCYAQPYERPISTSVPCGFFLLWRVGAFTSCA